ncbi:MAG: Crp/Fnr family transcriptional regulator, partial [Acidobacteria bacterium]|nr:Crp/Fnr family transcriptional regulator [Acidobacteriota bacterium]
SKPVKQNPPIANRILAALPIKEYQRLLPKLEQTNLIFAENIYKLGDIIRYVYFPTSGVVSLLARGEEGEMLEIGVVGNEGVVGLPVFLGVETSGNHAIVQGDGTALRIKTEAFLKECGRNGSLPKLLQRYTHALLMQVSQTVLCTRLHLIEARLICLLLMMHDRMKTDEFKITQEFLSKMLGVRREAVSKSAANLQQRKLIAYSRGIVSIINRMALEAAACKCYKILKEEYANLQG